VGTLGIKVDVPIGFDGILDLREINEYVENKNNYCFTINSLDSKRLAC